MKEIKQFAGKIAGKIAQNYKVSVAALIGGGLTAALLKLYRDRVQYHQKIYSITSTIQKQLKGQKRQGLTKTITTPDRFQQKGVKVLLLLSQNSFSKSKSHHPIFSFSTYKSKEIFNNLQYIKTLVQYTVSDVIAFQYDQTNKNEEDMKTNALFVFKKAIEIAQSKRKGLFILGEDIGALLALHCCTFESFNSVYTIKGLIIKDFLKSILSKPIHSQFVSTYLPPYQWQQQKILEQLQNLRIPTMLILNNEPVKKSPVTASPQYAQNQQQLIYYSFYKGRKHIYQIQYPIENIKIQNKNKQKLQLKMSPESQKTKDNSIVLSSEEGMQKFSNQDCIQQNIKEDRQWVKDMNYFMEIDIFMNNVNF